MSKSLVRALLVLGLASFFSAPASAVTKLLDVPLLWRTSATNANGFIDSSYFSNGATTQHYDTTAALSLQGLRLPPFTTTALATDSLVALTFVIARRPGAVNVAAGDSMTVGAFQFSWDGGNTWGEAIGRGAFNETILEFQSLEVYPQTYFQRCTAAGATSPLYSFFNGTTTAAAPPTTAQILAYPMVRWIIHDDASGDYIGYVRGYFEDSQVP